MELKKRYLGDDLIAVVWPNQSEPLVRFGAMTWEEAARGAWAMDAEKADRVRILVAVFDDKVVGAWAVTNAIHEAEIPEGKTRMVSRSTFETAADGRLDYLVGAPSPRARQRNPQATFELRDLPGAESLIGSVAPTSSGLVQLGPFTLTVSEDGRADLHMPAGATLTVRTAA
jgi:hypothetical protein